MDEAKRISLEIRNIRPEEHAELGSIMVDVYWQMKGFSDPDEQPDYYRMLHNVDSLNERPHTRVFIRPLILTNRLKIQGTAEGRIPKSR